MKNNKFCCNIDQIDICSQTVSNLQKNGIEFIWQLVVVNDASLILIVGSCSFRLIRRELSSFLEECDLEDLVNLIDSFLNKKISDFPEIHSLVSNNLEDKRLLYLFNAELSAAKKKLINIIHHEVFKLSHQ